MLDDFAGLRIQHRNLLEARMEIASYNQHARLLSSESWSVTATKFTRSGGADAVIQSIRQRIIGNWPYFFACDVVAPTGREDVYAAIAIMSSLVSFSTTGFISSVHCPCRFPACMS